MAARNVSPGGALLRASRLFSIPAPLPKPIAERSSNAFHESDTATLPYPTHLAITTLPSSLSKGDWGLKRPLPLRSTTKTSTPLLRVKSIDTIEHITEYDSAADHVLTLQKWQDMNIPLSTPPVADSSLLYYNESRKSGRGVFEEDLTNLSSPVTDETRWKFRGPWLAGLTVGEFNEYVRKMIRTQKNDFLVFLRDTKALEDTKAAQQKAAEQGQDPPPAVNSSDITDEQLRMYVNKLRQDRAVLFRLIRLFLDLPPAPSREGFLTADLEDFVDFMGAETMSKTQTPTINSEHFQLKSNSPYAEIGPPKTHPSAGLSYLRSNRYIYNHPIYGPQEKPPPIEGRIIQPKNAAVGSFAPKLGIAGVVTETPVDDRFNTSNSAKARSRRHAKESYPGLLNIEPHKFGGSKVYLHPSSASIDPSGRISLRVVSGEGPALAVLQGTEDQSYPGNQPMRRFQPLPRPPSVTQQGYGLESRGIRRPDWIRATEDNRWAALASNSNASRTTIDDNTAMKVLESLLDKANERQ